MRWTPGGRSVDLEDRRGGGGGLRLGGGLGIGGILLLALLSIIFKQDFLSLATGPTMEGPRASAPVNDPKEEPAVQFVSFVLDDAQRAWTELLAQRGVEYRRAKLVLFRDGVRSACGAAGAESGPFYCPADERAYVDLSFFDELRSRFGAPGDFAQAYVLAHEIGHHVQNVLGVEQRVRRAMHSDPGARNTLSVRMELQADCFAGVWAHTTRNRQILELGDLEEGLGAAAAVGDDRLSRGRVGPESFTHGSSAQRVEWFRRGFESGDPQACNTFQQ